MTTTNIQTESLSGTQSNVVWIKCFWTVISALLKCHSDNHIQEPELIILEIRCQILINQILIFHETFLTWQITPFY